MVQTLDNIVDKELWFRIQNVITSHGKLEKKLWSRPDVRLTVKYKVCRAMVLPALLYSRET